uniref:Uncharacterized protein n=1 Tax=Pseudo-nitzschia australis TaxID=44445 RepID=A0A6V0BGF1_9STRA|mmetsp:Transcript_16565/g.36116  ORF Transcript_16565/g.36116 Transcript_16565/m.36116 type:complete len:138 (+) Transcript_16565:282-695(+)|eukprot:CAMPEP_0168175480 /NCGR_PEP_ID=MMETSP0139_2-20121125/7152_1 /TAXON_ID=44445 /ORGANISM="Pseudo-nitzschia australis, Strain 10249 10 AB" /LENGTH=137 /DNA_ID=CAMNT_0008093885 /DNA_START=259 /DNA_END=672 /DNA_ORIENTATION=-
MISTTFTATTRTLVASCYRRNATAVLGRRSISTQGQEAVGRLKDALEQYRANNYQQEIPSRFKKELVFQCHRNSSLLATTATIAAAPKNKTNEAVEGIEQLLQNIGIFGSQITHDDVEAIVSELGGGSADKILQKVL